MNCLNIAFQFDIFDHYLKNVPDDFSPHHFKRTHSLGAGGPMVYSHTIPPSRDTLTCPLDAPFTRGGREVCT